MSGESQDVEIAKLRKIIKSMVMSYDILKNESPLAKNEIAVGVIRGAFIDIICDARVEAELAP